MSIKTGVKVYDFTVDISAFYGIKDGEITSSIVSPKKNKLIEEDDIIIFHYYNMTGTKIFSHTYMITTVTRVIHESVGLQKGFHLIMFKKPLIKKFIKVNQEESTYEKR